MSANWTQKTVAFRQKKKRKIIRNTNMLFSPLFFKLTSAECEKQIGHRINDWPLVSQVLKQIVHRQQQERTLNERIRDTKRSHFHFIVQQEEQERG